MENRLPCLLAAVRLTVFLLSCLLNQVASSYFYSNTNIFSISFWNPRICTDLPLCFSCCSAVCHSSTIEGIQKLTIELNYKKLHFSGCCKFPKCKLNVILTFILQVYTGKLLHQKEQLDTQYLHAHVVFLLDC